jgi:hypothetical protein
MLAPRIPCLVVALLLTASAHVFAQEEPPVAPGDRVRVTVPTNDPDRLVGTVVETGADTCLLAVQNRADTLALSFASVTSLEVSRGQKSHELLGGAIGLFVGFLPIYGLCHAGSCGDQSEGVEECCLRAGAVGGAIGGLLGVLIGSVRVDQWEEVPLDQLRVSIVPQRRGGLAVSVSVSF